MKKTLKIWSIISIMLLSVCLFAACGGNTENPTEAPTDEVYVDDFSSFTVFANGNYTTAFVLRENASSLDKQIANKLSAALKEKTGVEPRILTGTGVVDGRGIYIGDFGNGDAEKINKALKYSEGKIKTSNNSMYICFTNEESGNKMVEDFMVAIDGDGVLKTSNDFASSLKLSTESVALPKYSGGLQKKVNVGNVTEMLYVSATSLEDYQAYVSELEKNGFKAYGEASEIEDNHFATYTKNNRYVYAYYTEARKQSRIILGPIEDLPELPERNICDEKKYEASINMMGQDFPGQGFIFVLPDGRLILQDGGWSENGFPGGDNNSNGPDSAYKCIMSVAEMAGLDTENIVIAAWFISHPHDDHQDAFVEFVDKGYKNIKVESVVYNYGEAENYDGRYSAFVGYLNTAVDKLVSRQGTKVVKAHTGQRLYYGDVSIEVLFTQEDLHPVEKYTDINVTSMVIRMYIEESDILILGDSTTVSDNIMLAMWGDYLYSQMVQLEHHGAYVENSEFYKTVDAEVLLWPAHAKRVTEKEFAHTYAVEVAMECAKDVYIADVDPGEVVTIKLPYTLQNNKQEFIEKYGW